MILPREQLDVWRAGTPTRSERPRRHSARSETHPPGPKTEGTLYRPPSVLPLHINFPPLLPPPNSLVPVDLSQWPNQSRLLKLRPCLSPLPLWKDRTEGFPTSVRRIAASIDVSRYAPNKMLNFTDYPNEKLVPIINDYKESLGVAFDGLKYADTVAGLSPPAEPRHAEDYQTVIAAVFSRRETYDCLPMNEV